MKAFLENNSLSINRIIYPPNDYDLLPQCFVFPLLSSNPGEPSERLNDVIEASNPNQLLYIVCISFKDFINMVRKF